MRKAARLRLKAVLLLCLPPLFCAVALASCTAKPPRTGTATESPASGTDETAADVSAAAGEAVPVITTARAAVLNGNPVPGEPFAVALALPPEPGPDPAAPVWALLLDSAGRHLARAAFFSVDGGGTAVVMAALLAVPSTAASGPAAIRIEGPPPLAVADMPVTVGEREFAAETIDLDARNTAIRTRPDTRKNDEAERLQAILMHTGTRVYAEGAFVPPVASTRRTSFYGDRRIFRYADGSADTSIHAGVDYGVPKGTRVGACAAGRVVLAGFRIVTGNSVVIEHLPGVYSLYYHLDSIALSEGESVAAGTFLGESGATGLATGPHLHWEIRVAGENADPDALTARPLLDKAGIFAKLSIPEGPPKTEGLEEQP